MGPSESYDVIVIGGGPGGSAVSTLLADAGRKVLLLEREKFPRYHIGESLLSGTATLLKKLNVLDQMERAGFIKKHGVSWVWGKDRAAWTVYFKDAIAIPYDYGYQVERGPFDKMLLDNAREHGVQVLERHGVTGLLWDCDRLAGVRYESIESGIRHTASAPWIVDASGQASFISKQVSKRSWDKLLRNMAIWSYWRGAMRPEGVDRGNTFLPAFQDGWWWFIPLRDEITSIGAVLDRENYDRAQERGLESFYLDAIERTPELAERLRSAKMIDEMHVTRDWSYAYDSFCGKGWFAAGDAACFIDPLLSTGVHLAMLSGYLAAVSINTLLTDPHENEGSIQAFYQRHYHAEYSRLREKVYFLYAGHKSDPDDYFWHARNIFDLPSDDPKKSFISVIAGAFEHRSWYRRFARQLEIPDPIRKLADSLFSKRKLEEPLVRASGWEIKDDFEVDGLRLRPARVLASTEGRAFPLDEMTDKILAGIDGRTNCLQMVKKIGEGDGEIECLVRSRLNEALTFGVLIAR